MLRRFENFIELDPIELEKLMLIEGGGAGNNDNEDVSKLSIRDRFFETFEVK